MTSIWVLSLPETVHMVFMEHSLDRPAFARSKKVTGWQLGAEKLQEHVSPKKSPAFLKLHEPVAPLWAP